MAYTGNTQQQINYGSSANDGQGDPLRTAFIKTDDNFDALWATGPVGSNITIANNTVQVMNTNGNLVLRPNGVGVIQANAAVVPNATNVRDLGSADQRFRAAYIGTGGLEVTGNITANTFFGNGSQLTGITSSYGNANVATLLAAFGSNTISTTGNVIASNFVGNGALLTGITSSYDNANVTSLLAAFGSNTIVTTGNVSASNFVGNGSLLTGITSSYGNANVVANLAALGSNPVVTTGNITANTFFGNGSQLTGLPASYSDANVISLLAAFGSNSLVTTGNITSNVFIGNLLGNVTGTATNANIATSVISGNSGVEFSSPGGNIELTVGGVGIADISNNTVDVTGNITALGNISAGNISISGTGNVTGNLVGRVMTGTQPGITSLGTLTNINTNGNANVSQTVNSTTVIATGNITGNFFLGNGSQLTGIASSYGNANVAANLAAFGSNPIVTTGNITGNTAGFAIGYRDIPQISFTGNATLAAGDAGKHFYSTESTDFILTIANNASQDFQVGAAITIVNQGTGNIVVAQASGVTLFLAGNAAAGNRTVSTFGLATCVKVATDTWFITGTGVS